MAGDKNVLLDTLALRDKIISEVLGLNSKTITAEVKEPLLD